MTGKRDLQNGRKTDTIESEKERRIAMEKQEKPVKTLPFAPNTERIQPSTLKIILMTLGVLCVMMLIGWIRSKIGV